MKSDVVRLFQTLPHPCGYYSDRTAQNLVLDPSAPRLAEAYDIALARGYRRAGGHVYHPACAACQACVACRIVVDAFRPDRSQRRCLRRNEDITLDVQQAACSEEAFQLYRRYLAARHAGGGMDDPSRDEFERFLLTAWSDTRFLTFRRSGTLVGVAVTDVCRDGLSAVYTFFEAEEMDRGLGTLAILSQVELARRWNRAYVYLGYWIAGHPKMNYKSRFSALQIQRDDRWIWLTPSPNRGTARTSESQLPPVP